MLAHADIDHVRITFSYGDSTDRTGLEKTIRNAAPGNAHVIRFPKPAAGRAHVISSGIADDANSAIRTPASKRPNGSPLESFENDVKIIRDRWFCLCGVCLRKYIGRRRGLAG